MIDTYYNRISSVCPRQIHEEFLRVGPVTACDSLRRGKSRRSCRSCRKGGDEFGIRNAEFAVRRGFRRRGRRPRRPVGRTWAHVGGRFVNRPYGETWVCRRGAHRPKACHREPASQRWCGDPYSLTWGWGTRIATPDPSAQCAHWAPPLSGEARRTGLAMTRWENLRLLRRGRRPRRPVCRTRARVGGRFVNRPYGETPLRCVGAGITRPPVGHTPMSAGG